MENPRNTGMGSAIMNRINEFRMQHTKAFVALVVVLALMGLGGCSSALGNNSSSDSANQQAALSAGVLSFTVEADQWDSATDGSIAVRITGESDDGSSVFEQCNVVPERRMKLRLVQVNMKLHLLMVKPPKGTDILLLRW